MNSNAMAETDPALDEFAIQASSAGLTLPAKHRTRWWEVASIVVLIILVSAGVGVATGWLNLRPASNGPPGLLGPQSCVGQAGQKVSLTGSISADADSQLTAGLGILASEFSNSYGGCVQVAYPTTSAQGLPALANRSADFAIAETPPTSYELSSLPAPAYVVPLGVASVSVIVDLPGLTAPLRLNGSVLGQIYLGEITTWGALPLAQLNPGVSLPESLPISVVHRGDASPLNPVFTGFLASSNPAWSQSVGSGTQVAWPTGTAVSGGAGMLEVVSNTTGAIGYVATGNPLPSNVEATTIENPSGAFVAATSTDVVAAAAETGNTSLDGGANWTGISLVNAPGNQSYPISYFTYLVVFQDVGTAFGGNLTLADSQWAMTYLWWVATDGGYVTAAMGSNELPSAVLATSQIVLEKVAFDGKSVLESSEGSESGGETGEF
jgi:phosphate transport system substrate-binding protein